VNKSTGYKVFDSDLHLVEPPDVFTKYVDAKYSDKVPVGGPAGLGGDMILVSQDGKTWGRGEVTPTSPSAYVPRPGYSKTSLGQRAFVDYHRERGWSAAAHLEAMDAEGIDVAVLFPTRGLFALSIPDLDPGLSAAMSRAYNDWLYEYMAVDRSRMYGAAMITPFDVDAAVAETRRAVKEMGFKSVFMRANLVAPHNWHDPYFDPLWAEIADLGIPMTFHEAAGSAGVQVGDRFADNIMLSHVLSHPVDQMISVVSFCCGGILERHPDLRVAFLEGNCSWAPFLLWRMDEHVGGPFDHGRELSMKPSEYFRRQCYVSIEADEDPGWAAIQDGLTDRLVFSTDFPHPDSKYPESVDRLLKLEISDDAKKKILWDNCCDLYGFE
jgi:predicted TIM-barrel fold metal-dependent hydrolase